MNLLPPNNVKNRNGHFKFWFLKQEYNLFLKKSKNDISELNKALKTRLFEYIALNKNTCYEELQKDIYISANENEVIAHFCNTKGISRAELAELVKEDHKKENINSPK